MTYPPLPEPLIIDGRRLYAAGQMREYGRECRLQCQCLETKKRDASIKTPKREDPDVIKELFGFMGIRK